MLYNIKRTHYELFIKRGLKMDSLACIVVYLQNNKIISKARTQNSS